MNNKNLLLGIGGLLVVLIGLVLVLLMRPQNSSNATVPTTLSLPGSNPGRASGYKGAELMPSPNGGGAAGTVNMGTAPAAAPTTATGYKNSNLMPAPTAVR
ncbi:MAG: hypothetical protein ACO1SX_10360 [Actinomycetota bacterium]